jgi:hypothetical protein
MTHDECTKRLIRDGVHPFSYLRSSHGCSIQISFGRVNSQIDFVCTIMQSSPGSQQVGGQQRGGEKACILLSLVGVVSHSIDPAVAVHSMLVARRNRRFAHAHICISCLGNIAVHYSLKIHAQANCSAPPKNLHRQCRAEGT